MDHHFVLGFDRGSTREKISFVRASSLDSGISFEDIQYIRDRGDPHWPSAYAFRDGVHYYGHEAIEACHSGLIDDGELLTDLKWAFQEPDSAYKKAIDIHHTVWETCRAWGTTPWDVLRLCLQHSKQKAMQYIEARWQTHERCGFYYDAILCVPGDWTQETRKHYAQIALEAGLGRTITVPESACAAIGHLSSYNEWHIGTKACVLDAGGMTAHSIAVLVAGEANGVPQLQWFDSSCAYHAMGTAARSIGEIVASTCQSTDSSASADHYRLAKRIAQALKFELEDFDAVDSKFSYHKIKGNSQQEVDTKVPQDMIYKTLRRLGIIYADMLSSAYEGLDASIESNPFPSSIFLCGGTTRNRLVARTIREKLDPSVVPVGQFASTIAPAAGAIIGLAWRAFTGYAWQSVVVGPTEEEFQATVESFARLSVAEGGADSDVEMED